VGRLSPSRGGPAGAADGCRRAGSDVLRGRPGASCWQMDKVAIVTGGSRGIGLGIARALAREGWSLVVNGRRPESGAREGARGPREPCPRRSLRAGRYQRPGRARAHPGGGARAVRAAGCAGEQCRRGPDVRADILDATEESFDPPDLHQPEGTVLPDPGGSTLDAGAEGRRSLLGRDNRQHHIHLRHDGIREPRRLLHHQGRAGHGEQALGPCGWQSTASRVYEVRPGIIETDMTSGVREKYDRLIAGGLLLQRRWGTPDDVGRAVACPAAR
jgi:3-oxoacyl-[acyl-carrier protein] reductase